MTTDIIDLEIPEGIETISLSNGVYRIKSIPKSVKRIEGLCKEDSVITSPK